MLRDKCGGDGAGTCSSPPDRAGAAGHDPAFTDWRPNCADTSERFRFGRTVWWVDVAKRLLAAAPRPCQPLAVAEWRGMAGLLDAKPAPSAVDLSVPVICARFGQGYLPIDGWTRTRQAIAAGVHTLPCVRLTAVESRQVEV
jgi:hypothetical protein